jgi:opacity protein-like surface antigen
MVKRGALIAAVVVLLAPGSARADWLVTPSLGAAFGGNTTGEQLTYGASIGWMGAGIFGWEAEFAYTPEFFGGDDNDIDFLGSSNVTSLMVNALLGIPIGGQRGGGFRPYASGGIGLLRSNVQSRDDLLKVDNDDFGVNVGAGARGCVSDNVGLRGDIRYYRALSDPDEDNEFDIDFGDFDFWRATGGVTFRW